MINQTIEKENSFASRIEGLNYKVEIQTVEKEIQNVNETFRHLNVSLDSIQRMADEKDAENIELESKLSQLSKIKEYLIKSNQFEPGLEFNKKQFGLLNLNVYNSNEEAVELDVKEGDEDENEDGIMIIHMIQIMR